MSGYNTWQHTTCFEVWHGGDCCGCCDRGPCYIVQNALCAPCSFGVIEPKILEAFKEALVSRTDGILYAPRYDRFVRVSLFTSD